MKIRFISDLHSALNMTYSPTEFVDIMKAKKPADVTLIAGDMSANIDEAKSFLNTYFKDEKVIFVNGNHCLNEDTEVLTESGWKNIADIKISDKVYQYNKGYCELVNPIRIVSNQASELYEFSSAYFYQCVTNKHRMILSNGNVCLAEDLQNKKLFQKDFVLTCDTKDDVDYPISDNLLKLLIWIVCDGTIVLGEKTLQKYTSTELEAYKQNPTKTRIQFHLSKQCKINNLEALLKALNCNYTLKSAKKESLHTLQPYYIRFYSDFARNVVKLLEYKKTFPSWFLKLSKRQVQIVLDTLAITDGAYYIHPHTKKCLNYHIIWGHTDRNALDILQACCIRHGFIFKYKNTTACDNLYFGNVKCKFKKNAYLCDIYTKSFDINAKNSKISITKKHGNFNVYCLTVPSGAFLIRSHGKTSITGNCVYDEKGMLFPDIIEKYKQEFTSQWKFLENDYIWLNDDIVVIGCIGWTDYKYHDYREFHTMTDEQGRRLDQNGNLLPIDPRDTPEFKAKMRAIWDEDSDYHEKDKKFKELYHSVSPDSNERVDTSFKNRVSEEVYNNYTAWQESFGKEGKKEFTNKEYIQFNKRTAADNMNDFRCSRMPDTSDTCFGGYRYMNPDDCLKFHEQSMKYIKKAYKEIIEKNPNTTVIFMTHHPFTSKCVGAKYRGKPLNAAFVSDHNRWLKQFSNIKYIHCGHVHQRFFTDLHNKKVICNPLGYVFYNEHIGDKPFDINYILDI